MATLPDSSSSSLILTHPTTDEILKTHELSSVSWAGPLTEEQYIENESQLASLLATGNGFLHWILTQKTHPQNQRLILASCETICKRCLTKDRDGVVKDGVVQGVAGVFCEPGMRGRGYARRMMKELAAIIQGGNENEEVRCMGSVLWSDIGPEFYAGLGWAPFASIHAEFPASRNSAGSRSLATKFLLAEDVRRLCAEDEILLQSFVAGLTTKKTVFALVPDHHTMVWHHHKEDYICQHLFRKQPNIKGVLVGEAGNRVWAIWMRGFHDSVGNAEAGNTLYILRLVIENPISEDSLTQVEQLKAVLEVAQDEAAKWKLGHLEMWNPDEKVRKLITRTGIEHRFVKRETEGIPSLLWFDKKGQNEGEVDWIASERYAWC